MEETIKQGLKDDASGDKFEVMKYPWCYVPVRNKPPGAFHQVFQSIYIQAGRERRSPLRLLLRLPFPWRMRAKMYTRVRTRLRALSPRHSLVSGLISDWARLRLQFVLCWVSFESCRMGGLEKQHFGHILVLSF